MRLRIRSGLAAVSVAMAMVAVPAHAASLSDQAYDAGLTAYVHGYPPLLSALSQATFPVNRFVGIDATATPAQVLVVLPNVDTAYSVAKLDLRAGPQIVHVPDLGRRYFSLQLMDAYTNVAGYIASRLHDGAGDYAIVGPGWHGTLPAGMRALHSPTADALLLGRTLVDSPADLPLVGDLLSQFSLRALTDASPWPAFVLHATPVRPAPVLPTGLAFFDAVDAILAADPPAAGERRALAPLRRFGIGAGLQTSTAALSPAVRDALTRAAADGSAHVLALAQRARSRAVRGWSLLNPRTGNPGADYDLRAVIALVGLWANTPAEATYANAADDVHGHRLSGAHRYAVTFATPPPARAFWSLTMYDSALHLYANPLQRYAIGDRSTGLRHGRHGTLTLYLQNAPPAAHRGNWLPAPAGPFIVTLRLYAPSGAVASGHWKPPGITCLDCRP